ncbi:hypothetical protein AVEN_115182-1 [Araneus ventricosus]|uniref:Uncharacterized protein n=1 Tax=Araneus ventricosus TaxID=182803 RepID=A0A4Y1ZXK5_ARAVE|nr:hypothetical protein AVEN_115182-1 [Araneus ventricosus]
MDVIINVINDGRQENPLTYTSHIKRIRRGLRKDSQRLQAWRSFTMGSSLQLKGGPTSFEGTRIGCIWEEQRIPPMTNKFCHRKLGRVTSTTFRTNRFPKVHWNGRISNLSYDPLFTKREAKY